MEKTTGGVRERVFFPDKTWERFQKTADLMGVDEKRLIEFCASLGLRMLSLMVNPHVQEVAETVNKVTDAEAHKIAEDFANLKAES